LISVEEALNTILPHIKVLGTERVTIQNSLGAILSEDICAPFNVPPLDNSAMDGYAVKASDIEGASKQNPAKLKISGELPAGYISKDLLKKGEALRIMTGAPVPEGADTVVMQEDTRAENGAVEIFSNISAGTNIRKAGEDIAEGQLLFEKGTRIRPAHIGTLASIKKALVSVYQRPRVAILSTGDELVDLDGDLTGGKIVSSNTYSLFTLVAENGGIPVNLGIGRDTKEALKEKFLEGLNSDIILSSGGVSVGDYDFVKDVLQELGLDMKFWKVSMRPGQPLAFGMINEKPAFGLPGNPVSVMVSFEQFVRPAIRKMMGYKKLFRPLITGTAIEEVKIRKGKKHFIRCVIKIEDGQYTVSTTGAQGSGMLTSMAAANGLMVIPEDRDCINPGDTVKVQVLDAEFGATEEPGY